MRPEFRQFCRLRRSMILLTSENPHARGRLAVQRLVASFGIARYTFLAAKGRPASPGRSKAPFSWRQPGRDGLRSVDAYAHSARHSIFRRVQRRLGAARRGAPRRPDCNPTPRYSRSYINAVNSLHFPEQGIVVTDLDAVILEAANGEIVGVFG